MNLYPSPVGAMTDEELEVLSRELREAYEIETDCFECGYFWIDKDAERRYEEMRSEMHRRLSARAPNYDTFKQILTARFVARAALEALEKTLRTAPREDWRSN